VSGPTIPKTLRSDARRNRALLVASARELFAREGVDVPVEEITQHAGVGMGTLYRHFPTKDELIDAVLEDAFAEILQLAEHAAAEEDGWTGFTGLRARVRPLLRTVIERAQAQGSLRADFAPEDIALVFWSAGRVIETTAKVAPETWRRYLTFLLDGLRASAASPAPAPPLTRTQLARTRGGRGT
jgi:AcrR family transcriptional regulator